MHYYKAFIYKSWIFYKGILQDHVQQTTVAVTDAFLLAFNEYDDDAQNFHVLSRQNFGEIGNF